MTDRWPQLRLSEWEDTYATLHRWAQIVGKVQLALSPPVNHWWHASLRFHPRGLTTTLMPVGDREMEIAFDFVDHELRFEFSDGVVRTLPLAPCSVARFFDLVMRVLADEGVPVSIWPVPVEVVDRTPFPEDTHHASYDRDAIDRMWKILRSTHDALAQFRGSFMGKCSPVHLFWGAFDVAVTRFSGRPNPSPPEDPVMRAAYSHEVISHGFWFGGDWPGGGRFEEPMFYAYAVPTPAGLAGAKPSPAAAVWSKTLSEFVLPYDAVRRAEDPERDLHAFLQSTYDLAADAGAWPRQLLESAVPLGRASGASSHERR
jgi:hypothetical protein